jgi:hypothetical protein
MLTLVQFVDHMLRTLTLVKEKTHLWRTVRAKTNNSYVKHVHPSTDIDKKFANLRRKNVLNITFIFSVIADFHE